MSETTEPGLQGLVFCAICAKQVESKDCVAAFHTDSETWKDEDGVICSVECLEEYRKRQDKKIWLCAECWNALHDQTRG